MNTVKFKQLFYFISIIIAALIISNALSNNTVKGATEAPNKQYMTIEVNEQDTLWDIAKEYMNEDYYKINEYIDEVVLINAIDGNKIYSGYHLTIPIIE